MRDYRRHNYAGKVVFACRQMPRLSPSRLNSMSWLHTRERCAGDATRLVVRPIPRGQMLESTPSTRWPRSCRQLSGYHTELGNTGPEHALCGRPSVCVSTIHGGVGVNTVPELATIEIDRRLGPEEQPEAVYRRHDSVHRGARDLSGCRVEHDAPFMDERWIERPAQSAQLLQRIAELVREVGHASRACGRTLRHGCRGDFGRRRANSRLWSGRNCSGAHGRRVYRDRPTAVRDRDLPPHRERRNLAAMLCIAGPGDA